CFYILFLFFFQAEDGIRDFHVTGVQTCALPISERLPARPRILAAAEAAAVQPGRRAADHRRERRMQPGLRSSPFQWIVCSSNKSCAGTACRFARSGRAKSIIRFARNCCCCAGTIAPLAAEDSDGTTFVHIVAA